MRKDLVVALLAVSGAGCSTNRAEDGGSDRPAAEYAGPLPLAVVAEDGYNLSWREGPDPPAFVLYEDGTVLYRRFADSLAMDYSVLKLEPASLDTLRRAFSPTAAFFRLPQYVNVGRRNHEPILEIFLSDGTGSKAVSVYGAALYPRVYPGPKTIRAEPPENLPPPLGEVHRAVTRFVPRSGAPAGITFPASLPGEAIWQERFVEARAVPLIPYRIQQVAWASTLVVGLILGVLGLAWSRVDTNSHGRSSPYSERVACFRGTSSENLIAVALAATGLLLMLAAFVGLAL